MKKVYVLKGLDCPYCAAEIEEEVGKHTRRIVIQNIVIALGIKGIFLILGAFGIAGMWEAVFANVGVALIAVLNAMRILKNDKISVFLPCRVLRTENKYDILLPILRERKEEMR